MTSPAAVVAGTGTVGRDLGLYLLEGGWSVTWVSRDPGRLARLRGRIEALPGGNGDGREELRRYSFRLFGHLDLPGAALAVECVEEEQAGKREVIAWLASALPPGAIVASSSSAMLPSELHPACIGLRPFVPLAMTRMAELIVPAARTAEAERAREMLGRTGLRVIDQDEGSAFAATRLLLPVQALALELLARGWPAGKVDAWSAVPCFPRGILAFMDAVGLETIASAVAAYRRRMSPAEAAGYRPLEERLAAMVAAGKLGNRNAEGFLRGRPLPWPEKRAGEADPAGADGLFADLLLASCADFVGRGLISTDDLSALFADVYGADESPVALLAREGGRLAPRLREALGRLGLTGWEPASILGRTPNED